MYIISLPGVEKKNDDFRWYFRRKINWWDACTSLLLVEKHQESLQDYERQPYKYFKKDQAFWRSGGKQEVAKKYPPISLCEIPAPQAPVNLSQQGSRILEQSEEDLKWLKIIELIKLLTELLGNQPNVPRKPRKPDLLSKARLINYSNCLQSLPVQKKDYNIIEKNVGFKPV